jgi:hypothetical protein
VKVEIEKIKTAFREHRFFMITVDVDISCEIHDNRQYHWLAVRDSIVYDSDLEIVKTTIDSYVSRIDALYYLEINPFTKM